MINSLSKFLIANEVRVQSQQIYEPVLLLNSEKISIDKNYVELNQTDYVISDFNNYIINVELKDINTKKHKLWIKINKINKRLEKVSNVFKSYNPFRILNYLMTKNSKPYYNPDYTNPHIGRSIKLNGRYLQIYIHELVVTNNDRSHALTYTDKDFMYFNHNHNRLWINSESLASETYETLIQ
jgi:hypothetical protein